MLESFLAIKWFTVHQYKMVDGIRLDVYFKDSFIESFTAPDFEQAAAMMVKAGYNQP